MYILDLQKSWKLQSIAPDCRFFNITETSTLKLTDSANDPEQEYTSFISMRLSVLLSICQFVWAYIS